VDEVVHWSPEAREDLELIAEFIARDSEYYARQVVREMLAAARSLEPFPRKGRKVPEFEESSLRELPVYSYRLIYRIQSDFLLVVAVVHGRRLLPHALDGREP